MKRSIQAGLWALLSPVLFVTSTVFSQDVSQQQRDMRILSEVLDTALHDMEVRDSILQVSESTYLLNQGAVYDILIIRHQAENKTLTPTPEVSDRAKLMNRTIVVDRSTNLPVDPDTDFETNPEIEPRVLTLFPGSADSFFGPIQRRTLDSLNLDPSEQQKILEEHLTLTETAISTLVQTLCDYGSVLKNIPDSEYVTLSIGSLIPQPLAPERHSNNKIMVFSVPEIRQCTSAESLLASATVYDPE